MGVKVLKGPDAVLEQAAQDVSLNAKLDELAQGHPEYEKINKASKGLQQMDSDKKADGFHKVKEQVADVLRKDPEIAKANALYQASVLLNNGDAEKNKAALESKIKGAIEKDPYLKELTNDGENPLLTPNAADVKASVEKAVSAKQPTVSAPTTGIAAEQAGRMA